MVAVLTLITVRLSQCIQSVYTVSACRPYTVSVYTLTVQCTSSVPSVYRHCTVSVPSVYSQCTIRLYSQFIQSVYTVTIHTNLGLFYAYFNACLLFSANHTQLSCLFT